MISSLTFEPMNALMQSVLDDEVLLGLQPVIAGGFVAALYGVLQQVDSSEHWEQLYQRVQTEKYAAIDAAFGDVDFYFLGDSPIWQSPYRWLVSDYLPAQVALYSEGSRARNPFGLYLPEVRSVSDWGIGYDRVAETGTLRYQFMKQPKFSVEECLMGFDLINCSIAWHQNQLFVHKDFEEAFNAQEIRWNADWVALFHSKDLYHRVFTMLRAFKYRDRLRFTLSAALLDEVEALCAEIATVNMHDDAPFKNAKGEVSSEFSPASAAFQNLLRAFNRGVRAGETG